MFDEHPKKDTLSIIIDNKGAFLLNPLPTIYPKR